MTFGTLDDFERASLKQRIDSLERAQEIRVYALREVLATLRRTTLDNTTLVEALQECHRALGIMIEGDRPGWNPPYFALMIEMEGVIERALGGRVKS